MLHKTIFASQTSMFDYCPSNFNFEGQFLSTSGVAPTIQCPRIYRSKCGHVISLSFYTVHFFMFRGGYQWLPIKSILWTWRTFHTNIHEWYLQLSISYMKLSNSRLQVTKLVKQYQKRYLRLHQGESFLVTPHTSQLSIFPSWPRQVDMTKDFTCPYQYAVLPFFSNWYYTLQY